MTVVLAVVVLMSLSVVGYAIARHWSVRQRALRRLAWQDARASSPEGAPPIPEGRLVRWLALAGFHRRTAALVFVAASVGAVVIGLLLSELYRRLLLSALVAMVANMPESIGGVFVAILAAGPWILLAVAALLPTLVVRGARRQLVREVERDLPLVLELFATMAEAGLSFDAALGKIVQAQETSSPLPAALARYQRDLMAGVPRDQALRQLGRRLDVSALSSFTSAVIQAEQVGASIAETLRHQAEDVRNRRREDALLLAQALPVKLMFPLVLCFLPGIFVSTLAPVIYQMIQMVEGLTRSTGR
jgi:tight adherence protein C